MYILKPLFLLCQVGLFFFQGFLIFLNPVVELLLLLDGGIQLFLNPVLFLFDLRHLGLDLHSFILQVMIAGSRLVPAGFHLADLHFCRILDEIFFLELFRQSGDLISQCISLAPVLVDGLVEVIQILFQKLYALLQLLDLTPTAQKIARIFERTTSHRAAGA